MVGTTVAREGNFFNHARSGSLMITRTPTLYDVTKLLRDNKLFNDYLLFKYPNSNSLVMTFRNLLRLCQSQQAKVKLTEQITNKN